MQYYCTRILADHSILDRSLDWAFSDLRYIAAETCKSRLADETFYSVFIDRSSERSPPCWQGSMAFVAFLAVDPGFTFVPLSPSIPGVLADTYAKLHLYCRENYKRDRSSLKRLSDDGM